MASTCKTKHQIDGTEPKSGPLLANVVQRGTTSSGEGRLVPPGWCMCLESGATAQARPQARVSIGLAVVAAAVTGRGHGKGTRQHWPSVHVIAADSWAVAHRLRGGTYQSRATPSQEPAANRRSSTAPLWPVAGRCEPGWKNCDFSRATFKSSSHRSRRNNSLDTPRQGPIDTNCRPPSYVLTLGSHLVPVAHLAIVIYNGLDWRQRWFPPSASSPIASSLPFVVAHGRPIMVRQPSDTQLERQIFEF